MAAAIGAFHFLSIAMSYQLPPEWAPQSAVMLTWPRADGDFARSFEAVERCFIEIAVTISRFQSVHINYGLDPVLLRDRLAQSGAVPGRVRIEVVESNDVWCRDHGPITVRDADGEWVHLDFRFNGWGGKFEAALDDQITRRLAERGALSAPVRTVDFVLEGGGIEVDGRGTLLTTERCLLAPTRNPGLDRAGIEAVLKPLLGVDRVLWLRHGDLLGDDTDGHIDTLARFCDAGTLAYQACDNPADPHYPELAAMAEELRALRTPDGAPYRLVALPLPDPIHELDEQGRPGRRLPAGYANFLILNGAVLVPVYGDRHDEEVLARLRPLFPDRQVIGIDCRALIAQYGSLHCVTMQIPAA